MYKYTCSISLLEIFKCLENQNFPKYGKIPTGVKKETKIA